MARHAACIQDLLILLSFEPGGGLFSARARYALRVAIDLARHRAWEGVGDAVTVRDIARHSGLKAPFLSKVVQDLAAAGVVRTTRGPGGGVLLTRSPGQLTLADVVFAVDRIDGFRRCVLEDRPCREMASCPLHLTCKGIREDLLGRTPIATALDAFEACRAAE